MLGYSLDYARSRLDCRYHTLVALLQLWMLEMERVLGTELELELEMEMEMV